MGKLVQERKLQTIVADSIKEYQDTVLPDPYFVKTPDGFRPEPGRRNPQLLSWFKQTKMIGRHKVNVTNGVAVKTYLKGSQKGNVMVYSGPGIGTGIPPHKIPDVMWGETKAASYLMNQPVAPIVQAYAERVVEELPGTEIVLRFALIGEMVIRRASS